MNLPDRPADRPARISLPRLLLYLLAAAVLVVVCCGVVVVGKRWLFGPAPALAEGQAWPLGIWLVYDAMAAATLVAYRLQCRFVERRRCDALAPSRLIGELGTGAVAGILGAAQIAALLALSGCYHIAGWLSPAELAAPTLMAAGAAVMEEIIARGFVLGLIERWAGSRVALAASAVLFGVAHLDNDGVGAWPVVALTLGAGVALGAAYLATGRLWLPIGLHFGWNFGQSALFDLPDSGTSFPSLIEARIAGPGWLTGSAFGPEASVPGLALWVALGAVLLVRARRRGLLIPWRG